MSEDKETLSTDPEFQEDIRKIIALLEKQIGYADQNLDEKKWILNMVRDCARTGNPRDLSIRLANVVRLLGAVYMIQDVLGKDLVDMSDEDIEDLLDFALPSEAINRIEKMAFDGPGSDAVFEDIEKEEGDPDHSS